MAELNATDSATLQTGGAGSEIFNDNLKASPLLKTLKNRKVISGTNYKTRRRNSAISGGWRVIGSGIDVDGSAYSAVSKDLSLFSEVLRIDDAFVQSVKGVQGIDDIKTEEALSAGEGVLEKADYAAFNTVSNAPASLLTLADASQKYSNSEEEDSDTAENSVVVFIKEPELEVILGGNGESELQLGEWGFQQVTDGSGKTYSAHTNGLDLWITYAPKSAKTVAVVYNINESNPFTDDTVAKVVAECKGQMYSHIFLSRKSVYQLQQSRKTALMPTPPMPTESMGIPLVVTDSIADDGAFVDLEESSDS